LTAARVVVVAGKGGVGKTTVTAVIARAASDAGRRVLVVELDGKPALAELIPDIEVLAISAPEALDEYLRDHGFARIAKRLNRTGVIDVVGTAAPGIDDIVVLGKIKQLERSGDYDLIVVDGPAAGHAITFLMSAAGLADAVSSGPVRAQADDVLELLHDPERCQVVLVTLPETTPVNEVVETAFALEDEVGVQLGPVVVNGVDVGDPLPDDDAVAVPSPISTVGCRGLIEAVAFRRSRRAMEAGEIARLRAELPIPEVTCPPCGRRSDLVGHRATGRRAAKRHQRHRLGRERRDRRRPDLPGVRVRRRRRRDRCVDGDRVLRFGRCGQDDDRGGAGARGGPAGPTRRGGHDRSGTTAGRCARSGGRSRLGAATDRTRPDGRQGGPDGELWAMMLDTAATFDGWCGATPTPTSRSNGS
jgi:arsenite/tail-anchored protein-transporting ATPase